MSFPAYPLYKASDVGWMGDVPEHWRSGSLRHLIRSVSNGSTAEQVDEAGNTIAVSRIETISTGEINFCKSGYVNVQDAPTRFMLKAGDILFSHINSLSMVGNVAIYLGNKPLLHGMNLLRIQPRNDVSSEWTLYWLKSKNIRQEVESRAKPAINQASISTDSVRALPALIPPFAEQTQIALFLDHETARIDTLIKEQQRLIQLLKEKRQAVISHAVTKGLDPTVPMKDSGVKWLGEVPEHWEVSPLKYHCSFSGGGTPSKDNLNYWNGDIPWVSPKDMKSFWITDSQDKITAAGVNESSTSLIQPDALLMVVRSGILQRTIPIGMNTVAVSMNQDMKALRFSAKDLARYFAYLVVGFEDSWLLAWRKQGATVESIEHQYISESLIPIPPENETTLIVEKLNALNLVYEGLIQESKASIKLLHERRFALVSAAVTGKMDVRGWKVCSA